MAEQLWWCKRCDWQHTSPIQATAMVCPKGHSMRKVTNKELNLLQRAEKDVNDGTATTV